MHNSYKRWTCWQCWKSMYNLIEYSDTYSHTSESLWQFKWDESPVTMTEILTMFPQIIQHLLNTKQVAVNKNSCSTKIFEQFLGIIRNAINCKIHFELDWTKNCIMSNIAGNQTFTTTNTKLYIPIVTLSTKDNVKLAKQLNEGFKRPVYWNKCKTKIESKNLDNENPTRFLLDTSF